MKNLKGFAIFTACILILSLAAAGLFSGIPVVTEDISQMTSYAMTGKDPDGTLNSYPERPESIMDYRRKAASESEQGYQKETELEIDGIEEAAKVIYEAVLEKEGFSYEVCYNAKGNLYIDLGSKVLDEDDGKAYSYRLVYDRPSKNGACELFVLYRSAGGTSDEVIEDMYAVEIDTGKVVASGKKAWSDVGTKEYRELTGE